MFAWYNLNIANEIKTKNNEILKEGIPILEISSIEELLEVTSLGNDYSNGVDITPYIIIHIEKEIVKLDRHVIIEKSEDSNNYFERKKKGILNSVLLHHKIYLAEEYYNKCYLVNRDKECLLKDETTVNTVDVILDGFIAVVNRKYKLNSYNSLVLKRKLF